MLSALFSENGSASLSFGVAALDDQTLHQRAYSPLPQPSGELVCDPDFVLPTTAGPLPWRLFHYSALPDTPGPFGYGWRSSWPLRLCADNSGTLATGYRVTVTMEREDGNSVQYIGSSAAGGPYPTTFTPSSPRLFDALTCDGVSGFWDETRFDTGAVFHYPAGSFASLAYYQTVQGSTVTMNYTGGQLQSIQEPAGRLLTYLYTDNKVTQVTDWAQRTHQFVYDADDNLHALIGPDGATSTYQYDPLFRLNQITDPNNFSTYYNYDDQNRVISRQVAANPPGAYAYSGSDTVYTDPLGAIWRTTLDQDGNVTNAVDPVGAVRSAVFSARGLPLSIQSALSIPPTVLTYDSNGRETSRQDPTGAVSTHTFDAYGNVLTEQNPLGYVTTHSYFGSGPTQGQTRLRQTTMDPLGQVTQFAYTSWGALSSVQTPLGNTTLYNWNSLGTVNTQVDALSHTRAYLYDQAGNRTTTIDEMGRRVTFTFDALSRQTSSLNAVGALHQTLYDGAGNVHVEVDPLGHRTTYSHNAFNEVAQEQDALGHYWVDSYDAKGRHISRTDPLSHQTQTIYDRADRAVGHVDGMGLITTTNYDLARQPIGIMTPSGVITAFGYDNAGRQTARIAPTGLINTNVYDAAGQLTQTIEPTGLIHTSIYDADGRHWALQEPTGARSTTTYDADGRHIMETDALGRTVAVSYSATGLPLVTTDAGGRLHTTTYDAGGAVVLNLSPEGTSIQQFYDAAGRPDSTLDHLGLQTLTTYDLADRKVGFQDVVGNDYLTVFDPLHQPIAAVDPFGNRTTMNYDSARLPSGIIDYLSNIAILNFDASRALTEMIDTAGNPTQFIIDNFGRMKATQDALGYRTTRNYDLFGRVNANVDEAGHSIVRIYDQYGRWATTQDAMGYSFTTNFDPFDRVVGSTDPKGYRATQVLDLLHRPVAHVDPLGYRTSTTYTGLSQIDVYTDELGFNTQHSYDGRGNWTGTVDAMGAKTTVNYDVFSRPIVFQDPLGNSSLTRYDGYGRIKAQVDAEGSAITNFYDGYGRFQAQQDEDGNYTNTLYGQYGRYVATQDAQNNLSTTMYDGYGRTNGFQDQAGYQTLYSFDALQRTKEVVDALGRRTTMGYDSRGNHQLVVDARSYQTTSVYDPLNRLSVQIDNAGYGTTSNYDAVSNLLYLLDSMGYRSTFGYDGLRRQVTSVDSDGNTTTTIYDPRGDVLAEIDTEGRRASHSYDALGRTVGQTNKRGYTTTTFYDAASRMTATLNPRGYRNSYFYDAVNRQVAQQDALGYFTTAVYDRRSNLIADVDALGYRTTYFFDTLNHHIGQQNALGYRTTMFYDNRGFNTATIDALGRLVTTVYDELGRVQAHVPADNTRWTQVYDNVGNKIADITPLGHITTQVFDSRNRLIARIDPLNRTQTLVYDTLNRLLTTVDVKGQTTTHFYDRRSLETGRQYADGTRITNSYDTMRRLTQVQDSTGIYTFGYDANSNRIYQNAPSHPGGQPLTWVYDANDNRVQKQTPWGLFTLGYDARDQRISLADPGSPVNGIAGGRTTWAYDARRQPIRQDNPNGTLTTTTFDAVQRILQIRHATHAGAEIDHAYLTYDAAGRPLVKDTLNTRFDYGYDIQDRLLTEQATGSAANRNTSFVYDADGRRLGFYSQGQLTSSTYDAADQLLTVQVPLSAQTLQINCAGAASTPFLADAYFSSAGTMFTATIASAIDTSQVSNPAPQAVYQSQRYMNNGDTHPLLYTLPNLTPGATYRIRLHWAGFAGGAPGLRLINVLVNGAPVITHFDVNRAAVDLYGGTTGDLKAIVREVSGIADASGNVVIALTSDPGHTYVTAFINGIEVLLAQDQINCGGGATGGYLADAYFSSTSAMGAGSTLSAIDTSQVSNPAPQAVYQSLRFLQNGSTTPLLYTIPNLTPGASYHLRLHWATFMDGGSGRRFVSVAMNGTTVVSSLDVYAAAGGDLKALTRDVYGTADSTGTLTLSFTANLTATYPVPLINAIEVLSAGVTRFLYDGNGSLVSAITSQGITTYGWDAANRLQSLQVPSGYITTETYRYDDLRVNQTSVMGRETWTWDAQDVLAWSGPSKPLGGVIATATSLMVSDGQLVRGVGVNADGSALNHVFHLDQQGSVQALSSGSQAVEKDYETDAWGNLLTVNTADNRSVYLGGLGYWQEPALGLSYVRARWMDPMTGRWLSVDPVPTEPRYLYAHNSPTMRVDPSGLQGEVPSPGLLGWFGIPDAINVIKQIEARGEALIQRGIQAAVSVIVPLAVPYSQEILAACSPERVIQSLEELERGPLSSLFPAHPELSLITEATIFGIRFGVRAEGTYEKISRLWPAVKRNLLPQTTREMVPWVCKFVMFFGLGFAQGTLLSIPGINELLFMKQFYEDFEYFRQAGVTFDTVYDHYLEDPLLKLFKELSTSKDVSPELAGSIIGNFAAIAFWEAVIEILAALAAPETFGASEIIGGIEIVESAGKVDAVIARLRGSRNPHVRRFAEAMKKHPKLFNAVKRVQKAMHSDTVSHMRNTVAAARKRISTMINRYFERTLIHVRGNRQIMGRFTRGAEELNLATHVSDFAKELHRIINPDAFEKGVYGHQSNCYEVMKETYRFLAGKSPGKAVSNDAHSIGVYELAEHLSEFETGAWEPNTLNQQPLNIFEAKLLARGDGAQGLMVTSGPTTTHGFNAVVKNGQVWYIDVQMALGYHPAPNFLTSPTMRNRYVTHTFLPPSPRGSR
jgi:RHS repeat-associated protein